MGIESTTIPHHAAPDVHPDVRRFFDLGAWSLMTLVISSAAILIRYCNIPAASIGFWRVMGASVVLLPVYLYVASRSTPWPRVSRGAILAGVFLGLHFGTWAWAVLHEHLANAALFIGMQPAVTPVLGRLINRDHLRRAEYAGTVTAIAGTIWILKGQLMFSPDQIPGSVVALISMLFSVCYLVISRRSRLREHVALFCVPVYFVAAIVQAIGALLIDHRIALPPTPGSAAAVAAIILVPTVTGHTLAIYMLRKTKAHTIALSVPMQFILISIAAGFLFHEIPKPYFYPGAAMVLIGVMVAILGSSQNSAVSNQ